MKERAKAILDFWFVESSLEDLFKRSKDFDQKIRNRFMSDYEKAIDNQYEDWQDDPESCVALIILLDQFSRNLFRDDKQAFAQDYKARLITNEAVDRGYLEDINLDQKHFMLLPLLHSEDISDHVYAQNLCDAYLKNHPQFIDIKKRGMIILTQLKNSGVILTATKSWAALQLQRKNCSYKNPILLGSKYFQNKKIFLINIPRGWW